MVKLNKIYTRTGDDGTSGLVDGSRAIKSGVRLTAIGEVDEANCAVGLAIAELAALTGLPDLAILPDLGRVQNELFDLGADLATPFGTDFEAHALRIVAPQVERIEREIDAMNAGLAPLARSSCRADRAPSPACTLPARSSAAPNAPRSRSPLPSRSISTPSPTSTACRTICSCLPASSRPGTAAKCCGNPARRAAIEPIGVPLV